MKMLPDDLPNDIQLLKAMLLEKDSQLAQWQSKYELILEQWHLAQQRSVARTRRAV
jgi:transposase